MAMRTLLIAPDNPDLPHARDEVDRVVSALHPTLVSGNVTLQRVMSRRSDYDIIWFVAHGSADGVHLTDEVLPPGALGTLVKKHNARLVVLNTCESAAIALALNEELSVGVIATISTVDDRNAYATGAAFAENLAQGDSIINAYVAAKPLHNVDFLHLPAVRSSDSRQRSSSMENDRITRLEAKINRYGLLLDGDSGIGIRGVSDRMADVDKRLGAVERTLDRAVSMLERHGEILDTYGNNQIGRIGWIAVSAFFIVMAIAGLITIWTTLF